MHDRSTSVAIVGIPFDENSSFLSGCAQAPQQIREAFQSAATNMCTESGRDLAAIDHFCDVGDLTIPAGISAFAAIEQKVTTLLDQGYRLVALGGDHAVTYPIVRATAKKYSSLTVLHLDAHSDLYDEFAGNKFSHACPFARIMEEGVVTRLIQMGIRTMTPHQREQAARFDVEVHPVDRWSTDVCTSLEGPVYLSLDLDVLDPAYAPGLSHHEPGGVSTRNVLDVIQHLGMGKSTFVGADIVEYNPTRDLNGVTATVAAKCLKEIVDRLLATAY
jgi:agmatinase